jgi:hypothetical protein
VKQNLLAQYFVVQLMMTTNYQRCPFTRQSVPTGHAVHFTTHKSTICIRYQVLLAAYCKTGNAKTHLFFPSVFLFLFVDTYYILFYSLYFSIPSVFAALGDSLICLVINPAVYVLIGQERMCQCAPNLARLFLENRERL